MESKKNIHRTKGNVSKKRHIYRGKCILGRITYTRRNTFVRRRHSQLLTGTREVPISDVSDGVAQNFELNTTRPKKKKLEKRRKKKKKGKKEKRRRKKEKIKNERRRNSWYKIVSRSQR